MFLIVEKGIGGGIYHAIHRYAKADNKYMKNYDKNKESSYIQYLDANILHGWALSQKLAVDGFKWKKNMLKFNEDFIKNYDEGSNKGYILEVDVKYSKRLHNLYCGLPFLPERMNIKKSNELVCNLYDKKECVTYIRTLKQALNHGLVLENVHRVTQFNQEEWLEPYIEMNTKLRTEAKNDFEEDFFKLMNNSVFGKTMENVRKHRDIKLVTTDKKINQLVSEPNYHTTKYFSENSLAIAMKKTKVKMNKPMFLKLSTLDISKILMYEFWYGYIKPKYEQKTLLFILKLKMFIKILQMMLKNSLTHQTIVKMMKDHFQEI